MDSKTNAYNDTDFSALLSQNLLVTDASVARASRPNMKQFMDATGASAAVASEMLYGVIGSNSDLRNWDAIMASSNPVAAARAATRQLYNSDLTYELGQDPSFGTDDYIEAVSEQSVSVETLVAQSGNFALSAPDGRAHIDLTSSTGLLLRGAGSSAEQIGRTAWLFGFDTEDQAELLDQAAELDPKLASEMSRSMGPTDWSQHSVTDTLVEEPPESAPIVSESDDELDNATNSLFSFSSEVDSSDLDGVNQELQSSSPVSKQAGHDLLSAFFDNLEINWDDFEILLDGEVIHDGKPSVTEGQSAFSEAKTEIIDYTPNVNVPSEAVHTVNYDFEHH